MVFLGLGVRGCVMERLSACLSADAGGSPCSSNDSLLLPSVLLADVVIVVVIISLPLLVALPSCSLFSVDLRISDRVESADGCRVLGRDGVLGRDRTGLPIGL